MINTSKKAVLIILDGWGYGRNDNSNAIFKANTPFFDQLIANYPNSRLQASGEAVGLPEGQMGNSEVGHLNIGAGRVVYQELVRINKAIREKQLDENAVLLDTIRYVKESGKKLHLIGLVSDGGVHSHIDHLKGLLTILKNHELSQVYIHAFTDGRDTDPKSGAGFIRELREHIKISTGTLASAIGRYYSMDRDNRWERVKLAYDLLVKGEGRAVECIQKGVEASYEEGITDEFLKPVYKVDENGNPRATIEDGDAVICFNFRTDRGREITRALTQEDFPDQDMKKLNLHYVTLTRYDNTFKGVKVIYEKDDLKMTLGEVLENAGKKQIRIAETEKYPHVTFFFSGGREKEFEGEKRLLVPSPKVATYDLQPEMSAEKITEAILPELENETADFVCLNFANTDMVGHTGVFGAVIQAAETVDHCTEKIVKAGMAHGYSFVIIADHGNADYMVNDDGSPNTAHSTNLVPCIVIDEQVTSVKDGKLGDVAPTILKLIGLEQPAAMTGEALV
ncbi:phosphoglycerate mutase [Anseongella ginsenosidimutans]|uniref:2,3-bisphosphoglycerate-independent phosphoglycerate mutase n=1 Tax=Anseongella ginsenosidimutans TaxID=496056 RepID=A0A4R3KU34_9SPHI|nr:2,3-bisphosphoglycerate-independent phosphoglycerate mutase [Anseongella ginsenosidimutans]QEC53284.1 2,3-bisphosphoglycerate-independent phosphoglycerate mutase [Anseongella ginsenosidimutans]TCS88155.1 phosphoglycerate mutase [Anseongella ginsenosidimutans]